MAILTICVALAAFIVGNIVTFRLFLSRRDLRQSGLARAFRSSGIGFAVSIGIVVAYLLIGHLIWSVFG
jgi:hypothetical protein